MRQTILILANSAGGLYNFRKELLEKLIEEKYRVVISLPVNQHIDKVDEIKKIGCVVDEVIIDRHGKNPLEDLKLIRYYYKLIKRENPAAILSYTIKPNIYGGVVSRITNTPFIPNVTGLGTAIENPGLLQKSLLKLYKIAFGKAQTVFFQNEKNMEVFAENKIAINKHKLLPGSGVNINQYHYLNYPGSNDIINFIFVSRIMKDKGIDEFLEAANYITNKYNNTVFHIYGALEDDYREILDLYQSKNIIKYHGVTHNIQEVLGKSHCTIHPSYHEGMSNVLLESAASGRPVIASDIPGCREIFDEGISGFGFIPKSTQSLIEGIEKFCNLSNEEQKNMGVSGREKVKLQFNRELVIEQYLKEIKNAMEE